MENIKVIEVEHPIDGSITEHVIIEREDGSKVSMLKSTWDELEAQKELGGTL